MTDTKLTEAERTFIVYYGPCPYDSAAAGTWYIQCASFLAGWEHGQAALVPGLEAIDADLTATIAALTEHLARKEAPEAPDEGSKETP